MNEMLPEAQDGNDPFVMWGNMWKMHETSYEGSVFFLNNMLLSIKMDESNSLQDHLIKIKDIRDHLKSIDKTMEEEDMVVITLKHLSSSYANLIETLNITSIDKDLTFEQLSTKLLQQSRWKKQFGNRPGIEPSTVVLATKFTSKGSK
jgi:hypothetical protein